MTSQPVWMGEVELAEMLRPAGASRPLRASDVQARILVRLHHRLIGFVSVPVSGGEVAPSAVSSAVRTQLDTPLRRHLAADGLPVPDVWPDGGIGGWEACTSVQAPSEPIAVVVCTRDRPQIFASCLKLLQQLRYPAFEVIVVDNAPSNDDTRECFERLAGDDPRIRYVREPVPGLSAARNRGLREATSHVVAFTDDDVQVDPWWLHGIASGFAADPNAGCVTGLAAPAELEHDAQRYFDRRYSWSSGMEARVFDLDDHTDASPLYPYSAGIFGTGANFAVDRELFTRLGGFDEALGAGSVTGGGEDLDAFVRVLRAGRSLVYEPSAIVWHVHRGDDRSLRRQLFYYGVGLTAFLTKYVLRPSTALDIFRRLGSGAVRIGRTWRSESIGGRAPVAYVLVELLGMAYGPIAYVASWIRARRVRALATRTT